MIRFDCHVHIFEQITPIAGARYVPVSPAPLVDWQARLQQHGLQGGVIVQVSFLGEDNTQLLQALEQLDKQRFAGVAVVSLDTNDDALAALSAAGVRGVRWNLIAGATVPDVTDPQVQRFLGRLCDHDMHLEIQLESGRLAAVLPGLLALPVPLVIDHLGLPESDAAHEPWLNALQSERKRDGLYVKLSAPYRGVAEPDLHIARLLTLLPPERFFWGSDWPHTRFEDGADYLGLKARLDEQIDDTSAVATLYTLSAH